MRISFLKRALRELDGEAEYYQSLSPRLSRAFVFEIDRVARLLAQQPGSGRPGRVPGTREGVLQSFPHILPYRVVGNELQILGVFNTNRQPPDSWEE